MTNDPKEKKDECVLIHHKHKSVKKGKDVVHRISCVTLSWPQSKIKTLKNSQRQYCNSFEPSWRDNPDIKLCHMCKP